MRRRMLGVASLLILILGVFGTFSGAGSPSFSQITLADIMQTPLSAQRIDGSNNAMNQIPTGTIVMYQTNEGRYGVLEIASYGRDLTLNWRTYTVSGSVYSSGNGLVVRGTYQCDLDRGVEGSLSADFYWSIVNSIERYIQPLNGAKFGFPLPSVPGGVFSPPPSERVAYSISPPRSIKVVIRKVTLHFDLRHHLPWRATSGDVRDWTQWGIGLPQPGTTDLLYKTLECSCNYSYESLEKWKMKPLTYWPYATQYLISDPTEGVWQNFALCIDAPGLAWGTASGYNVSLVPSTVFDSYRAGQGIPVSSSDKTAIDPSPALELGPMHAKGVTSSYPYTAYITFDDVSLEWFRWSGEARLRAGNVILFPNLTWEWHATNPNTICVYLGWGRFQIDLAAGTVQFVYHKYPQPQTVHPTSLTVTIDDGEGDFIPLDPELWW